MNGDAVSRKAGFFSAKFEEFIEKTERKSTSKYRETIIESVNFFKKLEASGISLEI